MAFLGWSSLLHKLLLSDVCWYGKWIYKTFLYFWFLVRYQPTPTQCLNWAITSAQPLSPWWRSWACGARARPSLWTPGPGGASCHGSVWPERGSPASLRLRSRHPSRTPRLAPSAPPPSPAPPVSVREDIKMFTRWTNKFKKIINFSISTLKYSSRCDFV